MAWRALPDTFYQGITVNGLPAVGYTLRAYIYNTTTPTPIATDSAGAGQATSFTLNARGATQSAGGTQVSLYADTALTAGYKFVLEDENGSVVQTFAGPVFPSQSAGDFSGGTGSALVGYTPPDGGATNVDAYLDSQTYSSFAAAYAASNTGINIITTKSFHGSWMGSAAGPAGGAEYHRDGTTGAASTAYADNSGFYDATGSGFRLAETGRVTPYMFGLRGNGTADDTTALQNALTFCDVNGLEFFGGSNSSARFASVNTTATVTIPSTLKANFAGLRIEPNASMTSGIAVVVDGNVLGYKANSIGRIDNLWVRRAFVDDHVDPSSNVDGVAITGDSGQSSYMSFYDLRIEGFRDNLQIGGTGATAYILAFFNPQISCSWRRGVSFTGACENANFHGGFIADSSNELFVGVGIYTAGAGSVDAYFHGTSIDYCDYSVAAAVGVLGFYGCHFENNNDNPHMLLTKTGGRVGCSITMVGGQMTGGPLTNGWASIPAESATGRPSMINTVGGLHFVSIENTYVGNFRLVETVTQLVRNTDGIANRKIDLRPMIDAGYTGTPSSPLSMSLEKNALYVAASGSMTGWVNAAGGGSTWSADTVEMYGTDTGSREMVGGGSSSFLYQIIPVAGRASVILKAWIKCTAYTGGFATLRAQFYAADATTVVLDVILTQQVAAVGDWTPVWSTIPVPAGAVTMRFNDYTSAFTGTAYFSQERLWLI